MDSFVVSSKNSITVHISEGAELTNAQLTVTDITGRIIEQALVKNRTTIIGATYPSGMYFITLQNGKENRSVIKVEKL